MEARGNRNADRTHFSEVRALAAEQHFHRPVAVRRLAAEGVHVLG